jgi:predicted ATPase/DNA-binding SARP family transcriptional activator
MTPAEDAAIPAPLSLRLFGPLEVRIHGQPLPRLHSRKGSLLLALLALRQGAPLDRTWLAGTLWPDSGEAAALASLRNSISDLRRSLTTEAARLRSPTRHTVCLHLAGAEIDVVDFDAAIAQGDVPALERAVALYRGPLLEGCGEAWAFQERQAREQAWLQALERLAAHFLAAGEPAAAEGYLRRAVAADPLRESAQRALMQALAAGGNDAAALLTYRELRVLLHRELNAQPDPETQALFQQLREEAREKADGATRRGPRASSGQWSSVRCAGQGHGARKALASGGAWELPSELVAPSPPRDLIRPERVFQLVHAELAAEFLPLRGLEARPNNLPVQPTSLIGRERELATLQQMLGRAEVRLVTLTGPGGTGKTRLALQVAADLLDEFGDGIFFVDLAPIRDPGLVASAVAQTLGVRETEGQSLVESLKSHLREKQLLLVLDNFEQVLEAAPTVAELLKAAPRLKVLVTSRAVLRLQGEQEFPVPPLARPDPRRLPPVEALSQYAAVALFIQRAVSVRPQFTVTDENAPAVAEICHRLDGLPLAIELAAARLKLFSPEALLSRLERRLTLLTGGARDLPARQQTLRGTIAWSYDLLTVAEQALFRRLSVFVGGCTLEAAEGIGDVEGDLELSVLDGVASLVDQSVLKQVEGEAAGGGGEPRFVMLETIREFGLEQLEASGEAEAIRRRHAHSFLRLAEEAPPGSPWFNFPELEWLDRVRVEHDNLRAALRWSHQEPTASVTERRLVVALEAFWLEGYWTEREGWIEGALARGGPGERGTPSGEVDREELATWGKLLLAADRHEESIAIWRQLGDKRWLASALARWGSHQSVAPCEEAVSLFREVGNPCELIHALWHLGNAALAEGDYLQARRQYEESLALAREYGRPGGLARPLGGLGRLARALGDYEAARSYLEEAVVLLREENDTWIPGYLCCLGEVLYAQGDLAKADRAFEEALALGRDRLPPDSTIRALTGLGQIAWHRGELNLARTRGEESLSIAEEKADRLGMAHALLLLGRVAQAQGDSGTAQSLLRQSLSLCHEMGTGAERRQGREAAERLEALAALDQSQGRLVRAARLLGAAAALRETCRLPVLPIDRADRENQVAALRARLGEEAFETAWAAGRAVSLDEAVASASETTVHASPA